MTDYASLKHQIDELGIQFVDFRVADFVGRFRHLTIPSARFTPSLIAEGLGFDGSNYGYRAVAGSDMVLIPDLSSAYVEEQCVVETCFPKNRLSIGFKRSVPKWKRWLNGHIRTSLCCTMTCNIRRSFEAIVR